MYVWYKYLLTSPVPLKLKRNDVPVKISIIGSVVLDITTQTINSPYTLLDISVNRSFYYVLWRTLNVTHKTSFIPHIIADSSAYNIVFNVSLVYVY